MKDFIKIVNALNNNARTDVKIAPRPAELTRGVYSDGTDTYFYLNDEIAGKVSGADKRAYSLAVLCGEFALHEYRSGGESELVKFVTGALTATQEEAYISLHENGTEYNVLAIRADSKKIEFVTDFLKTLSEKDDIVAAIGDCIILYARACNPHGINSDDYNSPGAFAEVLEKNMRDEMNLEVKIGLGGKIHSFAELKTAFMLAQFALTSGTKMDDRANIYTYEQYAAINLISKLKKEDLREFVTRYVRNPEIYKDADIMHTVDEFMNNSLNVSETSRTMYIHRNTLIYRLNKIERCTGLNIRKFNDAMTFKLIALILKIVGDYKKES